MPLLSARTRARIAKFDDRVDTAFDHIRGDPVADKVFYAASAVGDFSLVWLVLGALRGLRSEHDWHAAVRSITRWPPLWPPAGSTSRSTTPPTWWVGP